MRLKGYDLGHQGRAQGAWMGVSARDLNPSVAAARFWRTHRSRDDLHGDDNIA
jgi:hypothetical protein